MMSSAQLRPPHEKAKPARRAAALLFMASLGALITVACGPPTVAVQPTFAVVHTAPHHGAIDVGADVVPYVAFSTPVGNAVDSHLSLHQVTADGPLPVDIEHFLDDQSLSVRIVPRNSLLPRTEYRIEVSPGLVAENGAELGASWSSAFYTTND